MPISNWGSRNKEFWNRISKYSNKFVKFRHQKTAKSKKNVFEYNGYEQSLYLEESLRKYEHIHA